MPRNNKREKMLPYGDEMITKEDFMIKCQTKIAELLKDCKKT